MWIFENLTAYFEHVSSKQDVETDYLISGDFTSEVSFWRYDMIGMSRIDEYSNMKRFLPLTEFEKKNRIFGKIAAHLCVPLTSLFRQI